MNVAAIYARLYLDCARRALASIAKSPWTLLLPMGLSLVFGLAASLAGALGILGGFLIGAIVAALGSCYMYFLGELVANAKVTLAEFGKSIGAYFWSVANVLFIYWIASYVLSAVLKGSPQARAADTALLWGAVVLLNAAPEVIYRNHTYGGLATIQRSVEFLQGNWLEWGIPNAVLLAALQVFWTEGAWLLTSRLGTVGFGISSILFGCLLHMVMVFRGHLFVELDGSSHRQRMFRYRTAA
jgi:hypothetical protein